jgi:hypothetical protein
MHNKVLTADNMIKRNWICDEICPLCYCLPKTTNHILTQCNFTVWNSSNLNIQSYEIMRHIDGPVNRVQFCLRQGTSIDKRWRLGSLLTFWWVIWKERNRRIFDNIESLAPDLSRAIRDEVSLHRSVM